MTGGPEGAGAEFEDRNVFDLGNVNEDQGEDVITDFDVKLFGEEFFDTLSFEFNGNGFNVKIAGQFLILGSALAFDVNPDTGVDIDGSYVTFDFGNSEVTLERFAVRWKHTIARKPLYFKGVEHLICVRMDAGCSRWPALTHAGA
ncbi:MAG: hypothetical protein ROR55_25850 [Devosia sp.]